MKIIPLSQMKVQGIGKINGIVPNSSKDLNNRLAEMGFIVGNDVFMANKNLGICTVRLGNGNPIAIMKEIADNISVKTADCFVSITKPKKGNFIIELIKKLVSKLGK